MGRYIPSSLVDALNSEITTTTYLLKVTPVLPGYPRYGVTYGNKDIVYDDGTGDLLYSAAVGMQPSAVQFRSDMTVDNAQSTSLMPEYDVPISEEDIRAGVYDFAEFSLYLVDYENPTAHVTIQEGTIGQVTIDASGLSFVNEFRGLVAQLKQSVCTKDSLTCRAIFGSQPIGSSVTGPQVRRDWCGYDAESLFVATEVVSVGVENTITFSVETDSAWMEGRLSPGLVRWLTGLNAGRSYEVDWNTAGGQITLRFETAFPIQVGDTLEYRPDCNKVARDESRGCKFWFAEEWVGHFRGEPDIPIGDAGAMEMPGASSAPGLGAPIFQDYTPE